MELEERIMTAIEEIENNDAPKHPFELFGIEHGYGWYGLTLPIIEEIRRYNEKNPDDKIYINQIKEKWGRLEIYTSGVPDYLHKMILKAGYESERTCEICGAKGKCIEINGWYLTLCEEHLKAKQEAKGNRKLEDKLYKKMLNIENYGWKEYKPAKRRKFKFLKMNKENFFSARNKINGKWYIIIIEREKERTNLFLKNGKDIKKLDIYAEYIKETQEKPLHEGYWYIMKRKKKISIGVIDEAREYHERKSVEMIFNKIEKGEILHFLKMGETHIF